MIPNWTNQKAASLREYLKTESGTDLLQGIAFAAEGVPAGKTIEEEALLGRYQRGIRSAAQMIIGAANFVEQVQDPERADIDIEAALKNYGSN